MGSVPAHQQPCELPLFHKQSSREAPIPQAVHLHVPGHYADSQRRFNQHNFAHRDQDVFVDMYHRERPLHREHLHRELSSQRDNEREDRIDVQRQLSEVHGQAQRQNLEREFRDRIERENLQRQGHDQRDRERRVQPGYRHDHQEIRKADLTGMTFAKIGFTPRCNEIISLIDIIINSGVGIPITGLHLSDMMMGVAIKADLMAISTVGAIPEKFPVRIFEEWMRGMKHQLDPVA